MLRVTAAQFLVFVQAAVGCENSFLCPLLSNMDDKTLGSSYV
jgi:hypothetical protein